MRREKIKIIIEGFIVVLLFVGSVATFINNPTLGVVNLSEAECEEVNLLEDEECIESDEIIDYKLAEEFYK